MFRLLPYQAEYFLSTARFPALVAGIGTGKTLTMLLKVWTACEKHPGLRALIVRKEYTDLRDSLISDFERYFQVQINKSEKKYSFPNGSEILFRHGGELNVLKNLNLGMVGIEQAEEFEDATVFDFLRDRLRQDVKGLEKRQLCIIANASGHNWIWERWKANPPSEEYHLVEATTFDNPYLPSDFLEDLKQMEREAPQHYRRYVLNSWEDFDDEDLLLSSDELRRMFENEWDKPANFRVLAVDPAWAEDEFAVAIVDRCGGLWYALRYIDGWAHQDLMHSTGKVMELIREWKPNLVVVDEVGVGAGVLSRLQELLKTPVLGFNSCKTEQMRYRNRYKDLRTEAYHTIKEEAHRISLIRDDRLYAQLSEIRIQYLSDGRRAIISKAEILKKARRSGKRFSSTDRADAFAMALYYCHREAGRPDEWGEFREVRVEFGSDRLLTV